MRALKELAALLLVMVLSGCAGTSPAAVMETTAVAAETAAAPGFTPEPSAEPESTAEPTEVLGPTSLASIQGDWGGYLYFTATEEEEARLPQSECAALLRMTDDETGVFAYCVDMNDAGSGCAPVTVRRVNESTFAITVESWTYQEPYGGETLFPDNVTFRLEHFGVPDGGDSEAYWDIHWEKAPAYRRPNDALATTSEQEEALGFSVKLGMIADGGNPSWHHEYDGLNGVLEGVFGCGEIGGDNIDTSNIFVFPLDDGALRLRYVYTTLGYPVRSDDGQWGIPEETKTYDLDAGGFLNMLPWVTVWRTTPDARLTAGGDMFSSYYKYIYIPFLIRHAQSRQWEDGFENKARERWNEDLYWDQLTVAMCKGLMFAAQEVIAGRYDGDSEYINDVLKRYKPSKVKLERYDPYTDPDTYIISDDLDGDGQADEVRVRYFASCGDGIAPQDGGLLSINGVEYTSVYYEKMIQQRCFIVDIDVSDNAKELAFVGTQEDGYAYIQLYMYDDGALRYAGSVWGRLDDAFEGRGKVALFPGDGTIVTYEPHPSGEGYEERIVVPEDKGGVWIGGVYFYNSTEDNPYGQQ